ncbi:MAG: ankyrin repeat domain-containing protein [Gammaproteobacteria bacterium]
MSNPRPHDLLIQHLRAYFPLLEVDGVCQGYAYTGVQAFLTQNIDPFIHRVVSLLLGVPKDESQHRITIGELKKIIEEEGLADFPESTDITVIESKNEKEIEEPDTNDKIREAIKMFAKKLQMEELASRMGKAERKGGGKPAEIKQLPQKGEPFTPSELKKQIQYAWHIREAFIKKLKLKLQAESDKSQLENELMDFDNKYPFIIQLIELEIFLTQIAVFHKIKYFKKELEEKENPLQSDQSPKTALRLFSPVALDSLRSSENIVNLGRFSTIYSFSELEAHFDSLEQIILRNADKLRDTYAGTNPTNLPFSFKIRSEQHACSISYDLETQEWIVIDANNQPYLRTKNLARALVHIYFAGNDVTFYYTTGQAYLLFRNNQWFLLEEKSYKKKTIEKKPDIKRLAQEAIKISRKLTDINMNLETKIYVSERSKPVLRPILEEWMKSKEFIEIHDVTATKVMRVDDIDRIPLAYFDMFDEDSQYEMIDKLIPIVPASVINDSTSETTLLLHATSTKNNKLLEKLLKVPGINLNEINHENLTALLTAVWIENREGVKLLVDAKADVNILCKNRSNFPSWVSPLLFAVYKKNKTMIRDLLTSETVNVDIQDKNGTTPLMQAALGGDENIVKMLLEAKANPDQTRPDGFNALYFAGQESKPLIVKMLLDEKVTPNAMRKADKTSLLIKCVLSKDLKIVKMLIDAGNTQVNLPNKNGDTPIIAAVHNDDAVMVEFLISAKANINYQRADGLSPLLYAVHKNNFAMCLILLKAGADVNTIYQNHSVMEVIDRENPAMAALLRDHRAKGMQIVSATYWRTQTLFKEPEQLTQQTVHATERPLRFQESSL